MVYLEEWDDDVLWYGNAVLPHIGIHLETQKQLTMEPATSPVT
jgi:hypothetical protein